MHNVVAIGWLSLLSAILVSSLGCGEVRSSGNNVDAAETLDADLEAPDSDIVVEEFNIAFVSSIAIEPRALNGLDGADETCNMLAASAGLPGTYVAWLSDSSIAAPDRIEEASGWVRTDGKVFATSREALDSQDIVHPLNLDETGRELPPRAEVITATNEFGRAVGSTCKNWTGEGPNAPIHRGRANRSDRQWTNHRHEPGFCIIPLHLYCFGIDHTNDVETPPSKGRLAWVSRATVDGGDGISEMDTICQTEGSQNGISNAKAFIETEVSASARFNINGPGWVRADGVIVWEQGPDLQTQGPEVSISLHANGDVAPFSFTWTGISTSGTFNNCNVWSTASSSTLGGIGVLFANGQEGLSIFGEPCISRHPVYCLED